MINYNELLIKLKPVLNKLFYLNLSEIQVEDLESKIGKAFPEYYRNFLKYFGYQQDFVTGLFTDHYSFVEFNEELQQYEGLENYIMIGDNEGQDFWMIRVDDPKDLTIYNWVNGEIEITGLTFLELINNNVHNRLDSTKKWHNNDQKSWYTQFAIQTNNEDLIYSTIPIKRSTEWSFDECRESGVNTYHALAQLLNKEIQVSKLTHDSWESTIYLFNWNEPINTIRQQSNIKDWESSLNQKFENFRLINFGIFAMDQVPLEYTDLNRKIMT